MVVLSYFETRFDSFLKDWHAIASHKNSLSRFLDDWGNLPEAPPAADEEVAEPPRVALTATALESVLVPLASALEAWRRGSHGVNVWDVAGLGTSELRIARVLAWFLNPRERHGLGHRMTTELLRAIEERYARAGQSWPFGVPSSQTLAASTRVRVRVESCPLGDVADRVDIELDGDRFLLLLEVKIMAVEGPNQLARYVAAAEARAAGREWGVLYLTRVGHAARAPGTHERVVDVSWDDVARSLKAVRRGHNDHLLSEIATTMSEHFERFAAKL